MRLPRSGMIALAGALVCASASWADTHYVDATNPTPLSPFTTPGDAANTIQEAVDVASPGDTVQVASGTYAETVTLGTGFNNGTLLGAYARPNVTGGLYLQDNLDGATVENFYFTGTPSGSSKIIHMGGSVLNLTLDRCVLDGQFSGSHGFGNGQLEGDATINNCEFKDILGWAVFESRSGSGGGGSPMGTINFTNNYLHHCNGSVVFRGDAGDWTDVVNITGNIWQTIGGNNSQTGSQWAAFEVNRAVDVNIYCNHVDGVSLGLGGEGEAAQLWSITDLDVQNNVFTNNYEGIWIADIDAITTAAVNNNTIAGNSQYGIKYDPATPQLDAENNWWGAADGPNPTGSGDSVSGNVDYTPWTTSAPVVNTNTATGYLTIQAAIDAASNGDTITIANGCYTEVLTINGKGLTLTGESEAGVKVQSALVHPGSTAVNVFTIDAVGKDITIENMTIRNGNYGIRSSEGNVSVLHCTFYHNGWNGAGMPAMPTQAAMGVLWSTLCSNGGAMRIEDSAGSEIAYCTVYENVRGIRYQDGDLGDIHDNVSHDNLDSGIYLAASAFGCTNTVVHDNQSYENMNNGILSIGGIGNTIRQNLVEDNWNTGVMLWFPAEMLVESNVIKGNDVYPFNGIGNAGDAKGGVWAVQDSSGLGPAFAFKLHGNRIESNLLGRLSDKVGVHIDGSLTVGNIEITNNRFVDHDIDILIGSQAATLLVNANLFDGLGIGVKNEDTSDLAVGNAEDNWWGSVDGPYDPDGDYEVDLTTCGSYTVDEMLNTLAVPGDSVSDDVDYCPWAPSAAGLSLNTSDDCLVPGNTLTVTLDMTDALDFVVGGQFALSYNTGVLSFTGATATSPFIELYEIPGVGTIDYAVNLPAGEPGLTGDQELATFTFTVVGETCPATGLVAFRSNPQPTQLSNEFGDSIVPALTALNEVAVDDTLPVFSNCPAPISVNADAGDCTAVVTWTEPTASDNCDGALTPTVNFPPGTVFPQGTTTVIYTATDTCGNEETCEFDVTVSGYNELVVTVELQPNIDTGNALPDVLSRCVTFELWDCDGGTATVSEVVDFDVTAVPSNPNLAVGTATVLVPCALYDCITVQDTLHTLRRTLNTGVDFGIVGTQYVADFSTATGAAKPLLGGNYKDDFWVDILDFGVFTGQYGVNYGTGDTTCATPFPHPDSSGNGIVGDEDFTFIQINFWLGHEANCCGAGGDAPDFGDPSKITRDGPVTRISVAELRKLGLHDLLKGDLNHDGWLDVNDMQAFMGGIRP